MALIGCGTRASNNINKRLVIHILAPFPYSKHSVPQTYGETIGIRSKRNEFIVLSEAARSLSMEGEAANTDLLSFYEP